MVDYVKAMTTIDYQSVIVRLQEEIEHCIAQAEELRKERDEARAGFEKLRKLQSAAINSAEPLRPSMRMSPIPEVFEGLETIESIIAPAPTDDPDDAWHRLARVGCIAGRLIAITRPENTDPR
jgi:hypothetical protein